MISTHATRRSLMDCLFLAWIEHTNARPWVGIVGAAATGLIGATVMQAIR